MNLVMYFSDIPHGNNLTIRIILESFTQGVLQCDLIERKFPENFLRRLNKTKKELFCEKKIPYVTVIEYVALYKRKDSFKKYI